MERWATQRDEIGEIARSDTSEVLRGELVMNDCSSASTAGSSTTSMRLQRMLVLETRRNSLGSRSDIRSKAFVTVTTRSTSSNARLVTTDGEGKEAFLFLRTRAGLA